MDVPISSFACRQALTSQLREREFFIHNLLVRIHFIIVMIRWTGLAPWEFEFPFPGSLTSTFLVSSCNFRQGQSELAHSVTTGVSQGWLTHWREVMRCNVL